MTYFTILGLKRTATKKEMKHAYRRLAQIHHPDKGGNEDRFKEIKEAYEYLLNHPYVEDVGKEQVIEPVGPEINDQVAQSPFISAFSKGFGIYDNEEAQINHPVQEFQIGDFGYGGYLASNEIIYKVPLEVAYSGGNIGINIPNFNPTVLQLKPRTPSGFKTTIDMKSSAKWSVGQISEVRLIIQIGPHQVYAISQGNLHCSFSLTLVELISKVPLNLPSPDGRHMMSVSFPVGYEIGQDIDLRNYGLEQKNDDTSIGSIIIAIRVKLPELSSHQIKQITDIIENK